MAQLTLKIEFFLYFNKEFEDYLKSFPEVFESKIDELKDEVYITYDPQKIFLERSKKFMLQ